MSKLKPDRKRTPEGIVQRTVARILRRSNLRKTFSELRKKLQFAGFANAETLVPQRVKPMTFPMGKIAQHNRKGSTVEVVPSRRNRNKEDDNEQ